MPTKESQRVIDWRRRLKEKAIIYKGGKCIVCSYNRCNAALDFHHVDPNEKDFAIARYGHCRAWLTVKEELDKCVLICNRCHREHHHGALDLEDHLRKNPSIKEGDQALLEAGHDPYFELGSEPPTCIDCEIEVSKTATRCISCEAIHRRESGKYTKIDWPPMKDLIERVRETSFSAMSRELGVSDNAIRKRIRKHANIDPKALV